MPVASMRDYLEGVIGMDNHNMRVRFVRNGFRSFEALVQKSADFAHEVCTAIRKASVGRVASRDVSMGFEERTKQMVIYAKFRSLVQRSLAYADATLDNLELVYYWCEQLPSDPSDDEVAEFTDGANKKLWFESLRGCTQERQHGFPLTLCH